MNNLILLRAAAFASVAIVWGCSPDKSPSGPELTKLVSKTSNALLDAANVRAIPTSGAYVRGEQDKMVQIEAKLPGFGGLYLDSTGAVVAYVKPSGTPSPALIRQILHAIYNARPEAAIRTVMAGATSAKIVDGQFTLSELIAVENRVSENIGIIPGLTGVGTSLMTNRVKIGFADSTYLKRGLQTVLAFGVPEAAIIPEIWPPARTFSNFSDATVNPTRGGIKITFYNGAYAPDNGSYGFNVTTTTGVAYGLTAGHMATDVMGMNGAVGDSIWQPGGSVGGGPVGVVAFNPAWDTNCPYNPTTHSFYEYCMDADIAAIRLLPPVSGARQVGTSDYEGQNGASGGDHIHGWYSVGSVIPPEYILSHPTIGVHKSGYKTGTTTGIIDVALGSFPISGCMGPFPNPPVSGPCGGGRPYMSWYRRLTRVAHMAAVPGDSGSPVFGGNGQPYYALGIVEAGVSGVYDVNYCSVGTDCAVFFVRWSDIENRLGLGSLNPATSQ